MTVSSTIRTAGPFTGNGTAINFPFAFMVFQASDLLVENVVIATGAQTTLVQNTDYTVVLNANQDSNPGGTVTLTAGALATGNRLIVTSGILNLQPTEYLNQGGFYPEVLTASLDRATILIQQLQEAIGLALQFPITDPVENNVLPSAEERANLVLGFNAYGEPVMVAAPTVAIGTTTTLPPGSPATVTNSGVGDAAILNFGIPEGTAATVTLGTVTTLYPGVPATVTNTGTTMAAILNFGIPQGASAGGGPVPMPQAATGTVDGVNVNFQFTAPATPTPAPMVFAGGVFQTLGLGATADYSMSALGGTSWGIEFVVAPAQGPITIMLFA